jgi:hypothetical protein
MSLDASIRNARNQFDQALQLVDSALGGDQVMRDIARAEALTRYHERLSDIFAAEFGVVLASSSSSAHKLVALTQTFAQQKASFESVFADTANRDICRNESLKELRKSFRTTID